MEQMNGKKKTLPMQLKKWASTIAPYTHPDAEPLPLLLFQQIMKHIWPGIDMQGTESRIPTDVMILENDTLLKPHQGGHFHCYKCSIPTSHDQSCIFTVIKHSIPEGGQQSNPLTNDLAAIKLACQLCVKERKEGAVVLPWCFSVFYSLF